MTATHTWSGFVTATGGVYLGAKPDGTPAATFSAEMHGSGRPGTIPTRIAVKAYGPNAVACAGMVAGDVAHCSGYIETTLRVPNAGGEPREYLSLQVRSLTRVVLL